MTPMIYIPQISSVHNNITANSQFRSPSDGSVPQSHVAAISHVHYGSHFFDNPGEHAQRRVGSRGHYCCSRRGPQRSGSKGIGGRDRQQGDCQGKKRRLCHCSCRILYSCDSIVVSFSLNSILYSVECQNSCSKIYRRECCSMIDTVAFDLYLPREENYKVDLSFSFYAKPTKSFDDCMSMTLSFLVVFLLDLSKGRFHPSSFDFLPRR